MTQNNIKRYSTQSELKSAVIERFNRTLNDKLRLYFEHYRNHKWLWILVEILTYYNEIHVHRTIGVPPVLVSKKDEKKIHNRTYVSYFELGDPICKVGDRVRITKYRSTFDNKLGNRWRMEIFQVSNTHYADPITYYLQDLKGKKVNGEFQKEELQLTKF